MVLLSDNLYFPDAESSDADGLVALGGDLSPDRLILAYQNGIFPWETEPVIGWYSPDPRCVLIPQEVKISKSMRSILNSGRFQFRINHSFKEVIINCKTAKRNGAEGSWISNELIESFEILNKRGLAYSAESWRDGKLVGGLYGLMMGKVFFGESMFSLEPNASKFALIKFSSFLIKNEISLIDCQVYSEHMESMGAILVSRKDFTGTLKLLI